MTGISPWIALCMNNFKIDLPYGIHRHINRFGIPVAFH